MFIGFQQKSGSFGDRLYPRTDTSRVGNIPGPQPVASIVTDGLRLYLDAGNTSSYPGTGTTRTDISGFGNNYTLVNSPTYVTESGGALFFDGTNDHATGPASNAFGITADCTIEIVLKPTQAVGGTTFRFSANENIRGLFAHTPYNDGYYFDSANQRIFFTDGTLINQNAYFVFRRRAATSPYREIIRNTVQRAADTNPLNTMTLNTTTTLLGAVPADAEYFKGNIYLFRVYNRALSDAELTQNYNADRARFGL